jgi:hypothetical protein
MTRAAFYSLLSLTALACFGCSGSDSVDTIVVPANASAGVSSGARTAASGVGGAGTGGAGPGGAAAGGSARATGGSTARGGSAGSSSCSIDADCTSLSRDCVQGACGPDGCRALPLAEGALVANAAFVACHVTVCDGLGAVTELVDPRSLPPATPGCSVPTCDTQGALGSAPAAPGTACAVSGGSFCDGSGQCVSCQTTADCKPGLTCVAHSCGMLACLDQAQDNDETDVDCGGSCTPCADTRKCAIDQDCSSDDCDALARTCLPVTCLNSILDSGEVDVDCGGPCSPCVPGSICLVNGDCTTLKCDPMALRCVGNECVDGRRNGYETDIDCGGNNACLRCKPGKHCLAKTDCAAGLICDSTVSPQVCAHAAN